MENILLFRRMMSCWKDKKNKSQGTFLKMRIKEVGLKIYINGIRAKYSMMGAQLKITPKILITKQAEGMRFPGCQDFIRNHPMLYTILNYIISSNIFSQPSFLILTNQLENLSTCYQDLTKNSIQLITQDWSTYFSIARGRRNYQHLIEETKSTERQRIGEVFKALQGSNEQQKPNEPILEQGCKIKTQLGAWYNCREQRIDQQNNLVIRRRVAEKKNYQKQNTLKTFWNLLHAIRNFTQVHRFCAKITISERAQRFCLKISRLYTQGGYKARRIDMAEIGKGIIQTMILRKYLTMTLLLQWIIYQRPSILL
ncbi:unnamed protein product [Paramecium octaurelia]|uniref:Uncharacterized protein n=1 Tax=Paramecium octaurelia TaxID=43137 RepID=A0A8S1WP87_PAROT|nr:unnamed protein product [Paramecium octaurelia]